MVVTGAFYALLAIFAVGAGMIALAVWTDKLTLFAPRTTRGLKAPVQRFCLECQNEDGSCPMHIAAPECPVWQFVDKDLPVNMRINPFRPVRGIDLVAR